VGRGWWALGGGGARGDAFRAGGGGERASEAE